MGTSKRRKKRERLHRNVSSLKVFFTNLQCLFNLWTGYSTPPCAEMAQLSPAAKAVCGICPTWTPSCRTNRSGGAPKRSRTAFGTRQDTVLDRYDPFNCCYYNVKFFPSSNPWYLPGQLHQNVPLLWRSGYPTHSSLTQSNTWFAGSGQWKCSRLR